MLARRTVQYAGKTDESSDLYVIGMDANIEVKRTERIRLHDWIEQARGDARGRPWLIVTRQNRGEWMVIQTIDQWSADSALAHAARVARAQRMAQGLADEPF